MNRLATPELGIALKEWASVCDALETGRQILLLRKGGISETGGEFQLEHPEFVLFPTYLHQNRAMLKEEAHVRFESATAEPDKIRLTAAGQVVDILRLRSRVQMDALDAEHIWTAPLIDMRYNYRPENPLYLMLVRVYRLPQAVEVQNTPAYAGCKSWVPLQERIHAQEVWPVLGDEAFEQRRQHVLRTLPLG